jgi:DNA-binding NarL/FixJ family response regulator
MPGERLADTEPSPPTARHGGRADTLRVMVVDDHQMVVQALVMALSREPDIEVVATATTVQEAVDGALEAKPDVLLIDYHLPDGTGVDAVRGLGPATPKIVFLSSERSDAAVLAALEAGACGYLVKSEPLDQLVTAVRRAAEGEILLQPGELAALLGSQRERRRREAERERAAAGLTSREHEILRLMARGLDNRAIAGLLHLALTRVRWYVQVLPEKLEVHSKLSAVARAAELGLIER